MTSILEALFGAGVLGALVGILLVALLGLLLPLLFVIGIWRIGTALHMIALSLTNGPGRKDAASSLELLALAANSIAMNADEHTRTRREDRAVAQAKQT
jgi:hypothetical protein